MVRRVRQFSGPSPLQDLLFEGRLELADACRAIRAIHGLSQDDFARRIGVNRKVVKELEAGRGNPRRESLDRIANAAGLRIAFIADRPPVAVMDSRKRLAEEEARRQADATALKKGTSEKDLYERNAMSLGGIALRLPSIS